MATREEYIDLLVSIAKDVNQNDIDWGMLNIDENELYKMLAMDLIDQKGCQDIHMLRATLLAMLVENFVLNMKILQK